MSIVPIAQPGSVRLALCMMVAAMAACSAPRFKQTVAEGDAGNGKDDGEATDGEAADDAAADDEAADDESEIEVPDAGDDPGKPPTKCTAGYRLENSACVNIDECEDGVSGCPGGCQDVDGSFVCSTETLTCPAGEVPNGAECVDLGCAFYQRLPGPNSRVHFIIDRSASTATQQEGASRLDDAMQGVLAAFDDPYFHDARVSFDFVPDPGQEAVCGGESVVDLTITSALSARQQLPDLFASLTPGGVGGLYGALGRARHDLQPELDPWTTTAIMLFDGASTECDYDSAYSLNDRVRDLDSDSIGFLPIGLSAGMPVSEESALEDLLVELADESSKRYSLDTGDPAAIAYAIQRGIANGDDCRRIIPFPPAYVGSRDDARLFAVGHGQLEFTLQVGDEALGIRFEDTACGLAVGFYEVPVPTDWYLGYGCTGP